MRRDIAGSRRAREKIGLKSRGRGECLESGWFGLGLVSSDQIWDILNDEPSGFVTD